ncbi:hypothetical protein F8388_011696 [Cannabis sativa]|uniref:Reverse transcriptase zinc-binding domain-containing protein n=1 Tax=Cannabis sativa TaxID=3483 RepID=A0A7J6DLU8_CANSA|nr:hypothetical protein G4B88_022024 [Cannabis sativa]KAF4387548.1 hypothetical protein F8388_011696 [Cannabis sativa]
MLSHGEEPFKYIKMLQKPVTTMEDLLLKASNLTVLDEDGWEINKDGGAVAGGHCAKARLCSNRPMSRNLLKTILGRVWGIADNKWGVEIKFSTKDSSFLVFSFKSSQDLNRILMDDGMDLESGSIKTNKDTLDVGMDTRKETMKAGYLSGKRDGSWREVSDPLNVDVPISYVDSLDKFGKAEDAWIPREIPFTLRTKVFLPEGTTLDKLIDDEGNWKIDEIYSWFHIDDIPWVLGIIPILSQPDWLSWSLNKNGLYSVASGYKLRFLDPNIAGYSNNTPLKTWWQFIWSSKLIPKMKNFIWRVFNQWIPTKVELTKRGMSLDTTCVWCKEHEENICHALWLCPKVQKIWKLVGFDTKLFVKFTTAPDFLFFLWKYLSKDKLIHFIGMSWLIWQRRNKFIFQNKVQEEHGWAIWALNQLEEYFEEVLKPPQVSASIAIQKWLPPPPSFVIINIDASLIQNSMGCGLSAVIRDHKGDLIVAETSFLPSIMSVHLAEAAAIRMGISLAYNKSIPKIIVASDCMGVINGLNSTSSTASDWGLLIKEILSLQHHFISVQLLKIRMMVVSIDGEQHVPQK